MKVQVLNQKGEKVGDVSLKNEVFGVAVNESLINQYVRVYLANQRKGTASTKSRGEVSGGGRKPWRQKGTGRARHGSIRSPIWVGGGSAHGPKPKSWSLQMPKKMRTNALFSALSRKAKDKGIVVIDEINLKKISTKEVSKIVNDLKLEGKAILYIPKSNEVLVKSIRNLENMKVKQVGDINAYDVISCKYAVLLKDSLSVLYSTFLKK